VSSVYDNVRKHLDISSSVATLQKHVGNNLEFFFFCESGGILIKAQYNPDNFTKKTQRNLKITYGILHVLESSAATLDHWRTLEAKINPPPNTVASVKP
jgi:hypothetical protein